ncbi:MAG: hypothetical protein HY001_04320 [Candidatus Portnoybacteria bacterium]|nr:hypothetical protein [Candidatus Portnoybacteria bacterium]
MKINTLKVLSIGTVISTLLIIALLLSIQEFTAKKVTEVKGSSEPCREGQHRLTSKKSRENCRSLITAFHTQGIETALKVFAILREQDVYLDCHIYAHELGIALYQQLGPHGNPVPYLMQLPQETAWCAVFAYHSFLSMLIQNEVETKDAISKALNICRKADAQFPQRRVLNRHCYTGIGYALVYRYFQEISDEEAIVHKAIAVCTSSALDLYKEPCLYGVFEGIMRLTLGSGETESRFPLRYGDPFWLCKRLEASLQGTCYIGLREIARQVVDGDLGKAASLLREVPDEIAQEAMWSFGLAAAPKRTPPSEASNNQVIAACQSIESRLQLACIRGAAWNIVRLGSADQTQKQALLFCQSGDLSYGYKYPCLQEVISSARLHYSPENLTSLCLALDPSYRYLCEN